MSLYIPFMLENQESDLNYYFCYLESISNVINDQNKRCKSHTDLSGSVTISFKVLEIRQGRELAAAREGIESRFFLHLQDRDVPTVELTTGCKEKLRF